MTQCCNLRVTRLKKKQNKGQQTKLEYALRLHEHVGIEDHAVFGSPTVAARALPVVDRASPSSSINQVIHIIPLIRAGLAFHKKFKKIRNNKFIINQILLIRSPN